MPIIDLQPVFESRDFARNLSIVKTRLVRKQAGKLYSVPTMTIRTPSCGRARLAHQRAERRYVFHALYAAPIQRGRISVIEDLPPLRDVDVSVIVPEAVLTVSLPLTGEALPFERSGDRISFTIPIVQSHQLVCLSY